MIFRMTLQECRHLAGRRIVGDLHQEPLAPHRAQREIFHLGVDHRVVWYRDQRIGQRADARAAESHVLHSAQGAINADEMADPERLLEHDQYGAEQVRDRVPGRECHREAADPEAGQYRIGWQPKSVGPMDQVGDRSDQTDKSCAQLDELAVQAVVCRCSDETITSPIMIATTMQSQAAAR